MQYKDAISALILSVCISLPKCDPSVDTSNEATFLEDPLQTTSVDYPNSRALHRNYSVAQRAIGNESQASHSLQTNESQASHGIQTNGSPASHDSQASTMDVLKEELRNMQIQVSRLSMAYTAGDCLDLFNLGYNATGEYYLQKFGQKVWCEMEKEGGGWTVIQRRQRVQPQVDFDQSWQGYKKGFGDLGTEFWIGNQFLHVLTNQKRYSLVVDFQDYEKGYFTASYSMFRVGGEASHFSLSLGSFSGNASDAFRYHHGRAFTTNDADNDLYTAGNCAQYFSGGWWYENCYDAHLNGVFPTNPDRDNASYITWWTKMKGVREPLVPTYVEIRIKPTM